MPGRCAAPGRCHGRLLTLFPAGTMLCCLPTGAAIGRRPVAAGGDRGACACAGASRREAAAVAGSVVRHHPGPRSFAPDPRCPSIWRPLRPPVPQRRAVAHDGTEGKQSAAGLSSAQPVTLGILSRPSLVETTLGLPPVKSPLLRPAAHQPVLAHGGAMVLGGEPRAVFQRSAVGTARTATGPPT